MSRLHLPLLAAALALALAPAPARAIGPGRPGKISSNRSSPSSPMLGRTSCRVAMLTTAVIGATTVIGPIAIAR